MRRQPGRLDRPAVGQWQSQFPRSRGRAARARNKPATSGDTERGRVLSPAIGMCLGARY